MSHLSIVEAPAPSPTRPRLSAGEPPPRIDDLAAQLSELGKELSVEQAVEIGRLVVERLYKGDLSSWRGRGPKTHSLRSLSRRSDLPVSSSALYRSIALYELSSRLGGLQRWAEAGLGISHLRLVLGLPELDQRRLLDAAIHETWTVADLEREAVAARKRSPARASRGGRPRLPRFVKSVNRLRKTAEAPDELFGDLDAAASMSEEDLTEIRDMLATIRVRCSELERALDRVAPPIVRND
ncbi:hypothetical protein DB30_03373 [Enhygromyxa salina]|uniref:Uncharacterized protein n=1 Tax=Enhygromyxa salina TaxID=215803 RepID=A0A0C2D241_9BACT|nr:hypothetical protein [Enhygromyxa salina]KIG17316.1 hypothetical protein DB30_03373 [Enhygromyxa salina]